MRSAFFGFHVASSGLHTARALMNVTSHNVSNAELPGFSRQVGITRANQPLDLRDSRGMYGTGSSMQSVIQMRDRFLDKMFWSQRATHGRFSAANTHLTFIETIFNNLPGAGVLNNFNQFFATVHDASGRAEDPTFRTAVVTAAHSLTEQIRFNAEALRRQQMDINREVADTVTVINSLGMQIQSLNEQIRLFERDGSNANDLRDQRALLIDELSHLVNVDVEERDFSTPTNQFDRRLTILINGVEFINNTRINRLSVVQRSADNPPPLRNAMDIPGLYDIRFENGAPFNIYSPSLSGKLRGLIDVRDGNGGQFTVEQRALGGTFYPTNPNTWPSHFRPTIGGTGWPPGFDLFNGATWTNPAFPGGTFDPTNPATLPLPDGTFSWPAGFVLGDSTTHPPGALNVPAAGMWPGTGIPVYNDVTTTIYKGIPFYMEQLNQLVRVFARAMNEGLNNNLEQMEGVPGHMNGFNADGVNRQTMLFTWRGGPNDYSNLAPYLIPFDPQRFDANGDEVFTVDYSQLNALNFMVNQDIITDERLLAASSDPNQGISGNGVILGFNRVNNDRSLFREGRLVDFIIATNDHLAIDNRQAINFRIAYEEISMQTHNHRLSIKGVDIDEEMLNLVRFQQMFIAASRVVNVLDTIYDTLINRLGNF